MRTVGEQVEELEDRWRTSGGQVKDSWRKVEDMWKKVEHRWRKVEDR